ncbi:MAG: sulfatase [Opitutaceae bacterium]|nr:sulfatase [Cytophagales bacterium]
MKILQRYLLLTFKLCIITLDGFQNLSAFGLKNCFESDTLPALRKTSLQGKSSVSSRKPNVILILADDLGYGDLSSYGQKNWQTPNIDKIGTDGARLTRFYTPMPYCAPTRASLLTGKYPKNHGLIINPFPDGGVKTSFQTFRGNDSIGVDQKEFLLSELLKEQGYKTKAIGKWHLGHRPQFMPDKQGFDEYFGIPYSNDMKPVKLVRNEKTVEYPVIQATLTKRYTEEALDFIDKNKEQPFFLYLPHAMPHKPLAASEEFYTPQTKNDLYADVMRELDWSIGQILNKIRSVGLEENTIVIFTSDNGPWFGGSTGGLRGMKATSWEGGIRVPFLVSWKGKIQPGQVITEIAGTIDVFPTIANLLKIPIHKTLKIDGKDLTPMLIDRAKSPHDALYTYFADNLQTVISGKWKLHVRSPERNPPLPSDSNWVDPVWPDGVTIIAQNNQPKANQFPGINTGDAWNDSFLIDLETDPSEQKNIAAQYPEVVKKLKDLAEQNK